MTLFWLETEQKILHENSYGFCGGIGVDNKVFAYMRISINHKAQKVDRQKQTIIEYSVSDGFNIDEFVSDVITGGTKADNSGVINTDTFRAELIRFVDAYDQTAKNPIVYITSHMLRHTGATRNAENGMDLKVLQYLMGHKSSKITNDIYNHVT